MYIKATKIFFKKLIKRLKYLNERSRLIVEKDPSLYFFLNAIMYFSYIRKCNMHIKIKRITLLLVF